MNYLHCLSFSVSGYHEQEGRKHQDVSHGFNGRMLEGRKNEHSRAPKEQIRANQNRSTRTQHERHYVLLSELYFTVVPFIHDGIKDGITTPHHFELLWHH